MKKTNIKPIIIGGLAIFLSVGLLGGLAYKSNGFKNWSINQSNESNLGFDDSFEDPIDNEPYMLFDYVETQIYDDGEFYEEYINRETPNYNIYYYDSGWVNSNISIDFTIMGPSSRSSSNSQFIFSHLSGYETSYYGKSCKLSLPISLPQKSINEIVVEHLELLIPSEEFSPLNYLLRLEIQNDAYFGDIPLSGCYIDFNFHSYESGYLGQDLHLALNDGFINFGGNNYTFETFKSYAQSNGFDIDSSDIFALVDTISLIMPMGYKYFVEELDGDNNPYLEENYTSSEISFYNILFYYE